MGTDAIRAIGDIVLAEMYGAKEAAKASGTPEGRMAMTEVSELLMNEYLKIERFLDR
jgi:hypothetical protein